MKVRFVTLGCKVNAQETQRLREGLLTAGFTPAPESEKADLIVVNTCSVTHLSDAKSRRSIEAAKREGGYVAVLGCYVTLQEERPAGVDLWLGSEEKGEALDSILQAFGLESTEVDSRAEFHPRTRAFIKVQDGCDSYCSYCIIPYARGPARSLSEEEILEEVDLRLQEGVQELVLTGIHLSSYGKDMGTSLIELIQKVAEKGAARIRLGSLEQSIITREFLKCLQEIPAFCPHFHLSLQSGSAKVLREMNRKYSPQEYAEKVRLIRAVFPHAAITTDIIVGFPTETEEDFEETMRFVKEIGFSQLHVFAFSKREGTEAAKMNDLPPQVKKERSARLRKTAQALQEAFLDRFIGEEVEILFEDNGGVTREYLRVEVSLPPKAGTIQRRSVHRRVGTSLRA